MYFFQKNDCLCRRCYHALYTTGLYNQTFCQIQQEQPDENEEFPLDFVAFFDRIRERKTWEHFAKGYFQVVWPEYKTFNDAGKYLE